MSYYATLGGGIVVEENNFNEVLEKAEKIFPCAEKWKDKIEVSGYDNYHEEEIQDFLNEIAPYTESGEIFFTGEDDTRWKFKFTGSNWEEFNSKCVYEGEPFIESSSDKGELVGQLIDQIQDNLHPTYTIDGELYETLKSKITETLHNWSIL